MSVLFDLLQSFARFQLQKQRMSKFKFEPPQQQRRSIQNKHYDVTLLTTLQKCTQIIRQDRLFLRNQIINGNSQVVDTIRKYAKASQLQNLQVKLRKYLQFIKNKMKSQQLQTFKQALRVNNTHLVQKRENHQLKSYMSTSKHPLRTDTDELNQSHTLKNYRSQDHYATTHQLTMNSSLQHFQELLKLKYSQEVIEERESENVTSARQARQEHEQRRSKPLHEQLFDSLDNKIAGRLAKGYLPGKQGENQPREEKKSKEKYKQLTLKPLSWQFERKAKGTLYNATGSQKKQAGIAQKARKERINDNRVGESLEDSIYYKHFNDSNHSALQNQSQYIATDHRQYHNSSIKSFAQQQPKPEAEPILAQMNRLEGLRKSQQDIFTPLDLLNQCRNFIKQRENSNSKPIHTFTQDKQPQAEVYHPNQYLKQYNPHSISKEEVTHFNAEIPFSFSIEQFLECLMEVTQMQPFISTQSLLKYINLHQNSQTLKQTFRTYLQQPHQICLTQLANTLNDEYNSDHNAQYPHEDKLVASVYNLLDIDQKGFISHFDVTSFLEQLQTAEVHNFATLSQELWKLFNGADFANEHQITYWHFYLIKESEEMARVKGLLDEFDFEIDRDEDE